MPKFFFILFIVIIPSLLLATKQTDERDKKMLELDIKCEKARQKAMWPIKLEIFQNCMKEHKYKKKAEEKCEKLAEEYNGHRIRGTARFYDLPECVVAFEFRQNTDY